MKHIPDTVQDIFPEIIKEQSIALFTANPEDYPEKVWALHSNLAKGIMVNHGATLLDAHYRAAYLLRILFQINKQFNIDYEERLEEELQVIRKG